VSKLYRYNIGGVYMRLKPDTMLITKKYCINPDDIKRKYDLYTRLGVPTTYDEAARSIAIERRISEIEKNGF
jgi:hypothetical protein